MSGVAIALGAGSKRATVDPVAAALLRRAGLVAPGLLASGRKVKRPGRRSVPVGPGLLALEADVLSLGYLLGPRLRAYLAEQAAERLAAIGLGLLAALEATLGEDKPHVPLFRNFPRSVPADTYDLYVQRVFTLLLQEPYQPCVLCAQVGGVHPVAPCAHLICAACWDLDDYAGCPLCHGRVDPCEPFLDPADLVRDNRQVPLPRRVEVLELVDDLNRSVYQAIAVMLARRTPLSPQDRGDLRALLDRVGHGDLGWLPDEIPIRETRALVLARLVVDPSLADRLPGLVTTHIGTATDALRLLYVLHGGDAGMTSAPERRRSRPRRMRRILLARLDALPLAALVEDLHRHGAAWQRMAENLHPFEQAQPPTPAWRRRSPRCAVPRSTPPPHSGGYSPTWPPRIRRCCTTTGVGCGRHALGGADRECRRGRGRAHRGRSARPASGACWPAGCSGSPPVPMIRKRWSRRPAPPCVRCRPGCCSPRWVRSGRPPGRPAPGCTFRGAAVPDCGPSRIIGRDSTRTSAPRSTPCSPGSCWTAPPGCRPSTSPCWTPAWPTSSRRSPSAPRRRPWYGLPRGSSQPLPGGRILRLFLHWTQPAGTRVDLDLSVAMYDSEGGFVGWCDYTRLRFAERAAVHSGDLTSAPAPLGASEFVDLDVPALRRRGIRYLTMVVFSYNDVPFEAMTDAFAGFMGDPGQGGTAFEPKAVEQRFDLTGSVKVATPLLVDLNEGRLRWVDAAMAGAGSHHSVGRYSRTLGRLTVAADRYFAAGRRVSLWEVACWHAATRAATVLVRHRDGTVVGYRRGGAETPSAFAARLAALSPPDDNSTAPGGPLPDFAALVKGDAELAEGAQVYALYRSGLDASTIRLVDAGDLIGALAR